MNFYIFMCVYLDIVSIFGTQSVLLWHALLTKRSVLLLYPTDNLNLNNLNINNNNNNDSDEEENNNNNKNSKIETLINLIRAFPLFVFHRQDWSVLRPFVTARYVYIFIFIYLLIFLFIIILFIYIFIYLNLLLIILFYLN